MREAGNRVPPGAALEWGEGAPEDLGRMRWSGSRPGLRGALLGWAGDPTRVAACRGDPETPRGVFITQTLQLGRAGLGTAARARWVCGGVQEAAAAGLMPPDYWLEENQGVRGLFLGEESTRVCERSNSPTWWAWPQQETATEHTRLQAAERPAQLQSRLCSCPGSGAVSFPR